MARARAASQRRPAELSLAPPMVDESDDDHRPDNHEQEPREFGIVHCVSIRGTYVAGKRRRARFNREEGPVRPRRAPCRLPRGSEPPANRTGAELIQVSAQVPPKG